MNVQGECCTQTEMASCSKERYIPRLLRQLIADYRQKRKQSISMEKLSRLSDCQLCDIGLHRGDLGISRRELDESLRLARVRFQSPRL
ncbi:hypothetical protein AB833_04330 [Chromatiales bacterium (ex Bugula neritina AB1)]|nr:hypothetical protein AB833_04330 [Chromatiales bacterium (ex Bugula neritina AB1)]